MIVVFIFFFAMFFKIFMELNREFNELEISDGDILSKFIDINEEENRLTPKSNFESFIIMVYFSTTTFSRVGLGDFYPITSSERIFISVGLLMGTMIVLNFIGIFVGSVQHYLLPQMSDNEVELEMFF